MTNSRCNVAAGHHMQQCQNQHGLYADLQVEVSILSLTAVYLVTKLISDF